MRGTATAALALFACAVFPNIAAAQWDNTPCQDVANNPPGVYHLTITMPFQVGPSTYVTLITNTSGVTTTANPVIWCFRK